MGVDVACQLRSANGAHCQLAAEGNWGICLYKKYIQNNIQVVEEARLPFRLLDNVRRAWKYGWPDTHWPGQACGASSIRIRFA